MDGLLYERFMYHDSQVHLLTVDLMERDLRPVLADDAFPFLRIYPAVEAISQGALACTGGGFNTVWAHHLGYADQPLHALVVDREIWTTGVGYGGDGVLLGPHSIEARPNRIRVVLWRANKTPIEIMRINRSHGTGISAFTARGGTNQRAIADKHYALIGAPGWWTQSEHGAAQHRVMTVLEVGEEPLQAEGTGVVLEAPWPMKLRVGDEVTWVQRLGGKNVRHIISGWPQILRGGINVVPQLEMDPQAPDGPDGWFVRENPRLCIGGSKNGRTAYLCVVQGRIETSEGLRLKELAAFMQSHGAHDAVNFDGGGSSYMWMKEGGLVADSTYGDGTIQGLRPDHYATSIF